MKFPVFVQLVLGILLITDFPTPNPQVHSYVQMIRIAVTFALFGYILRDQKG